MELYKTPPEKYYEACITYHLVEYYRMLYRRRLYPFSISQIREKELGFDFGYETARGHVFLLQYKRPIGVGARGYFWDIEKEQAETLTQLPVRSYYVLPAFSKSKEWYDGLDKTYFLPTQMVCNWLRYQNVEKKARLHQREPLVRNSDPRGFDLFEKELNSALSARQPGYRTDFEEALMQIPETWGICGYWIGGEDDHDFG